MINKGKKKKHLFFALREEWWLAWGNGVNERKSLLLLLLFVLHWDWVFWVLGGLARLGIMAICLEWDMDIGIGMGWVFFFGGDWDGEVEN